MSCNIIDEYERLFKGDKTVSRAHAVENIKPKEKTIIDIYNELLSENSTDNKK